MFFSDYYLWYFIMLYFVGPLHGISFILEEYPYVYEYIYLVYFVYYPFIFYSSC